MIFFNGLPLAGHSPKLTNFWHNANHENLCPGGRKPEEALYCQHTTENPVFI
jgi:hypothetical protein